MPCQFTTPAKVCDNLPDPVCPCGCNGDCGCGGDCGCNGDCGCDCGCNSYSGGVPTVGTNDSGATMDTSNYSSGIPAVGGASVPSQTPSQGPQRPNRSRSQRNRNNQPNQNGMPIGFPIINLNVNQSPTTLIEELRGATRNQGDPYPVVQAVPPIQVQPPPVAVPPVQVQPPPVAVPPIQVQPSPVSVPPVQVQPPPVQVPPIQVQQGSNGIPTVSVPTPTTITKVIPNVIGTRPIAKTRTVVVHKEPVFY